MVKTPYIGQMDRMISIVNLEKGGDAAGGIVTTETPVCTVFSAMDDKSFAGSESLDGKVMNMANREYTIRYNHSVAISGKDFVIDDGGSRFRITRVLEVGRRRFLTLISELYG